MSAVYIIAGIILILKGNSTNDTFQAGLIGWILCGYGVYRILSRVMLNKNSEKAE